MGVGSSSLGKRSTRIVAAIGAAALAVCSVSSAPARADPDPDHILQNVSVTMRPDGAITKIGSTAVSGVAGHPEDARTATTAFDPGRTASDVPVRVLTSYRTKSGSGTDLSDLKGRSGRIQIDLTVQNLTVAPKNISYDVAGTSVTRPALVGSPLTVVASTKLPGVRAAALVSPTAGSTSASPTTNGVVSQSAKGEAQVQWAALLAPPQLSANATLRLVVDAKNFQVPAFDVAVQPGMVTDPSIAGLLDSSMQTGPTSELALQARTIQLVSQVNSVLVKASTTVSTVRSSLDTSSKTVGDKTVSDLASGSKNIAASMKSLSGQIDSLGKSVSAQMTTSQSAMLTQLSKTIATSQQLLGDTSAQPVTAQTSGTGCSTSVAKPQKDPSVYGTLLQMSSQLDGYAKATTDCRASLQQAILATAGPASPTAEQCRPDKATPVSSSATCALLDTQQKLDAVIDTLQKDGDAAAEKLGNSLSKGATGKAQDIVDKVATISDDLDKTSTNLGQAIKALEGISTELGQMATSLDSLSTMTSTINRQATQGLSTENDITSTDAKLAKELCTVADSSASKSSGSDKAPASTSKKATLPPDQVERLRSYLTTTSCPDADGNTKPLPPPEGVTPAETGHQKQTKAWQSIVDATTASEKDSEDDHDNLPDAIAAVKDQRSKVATNVTKLITSTFLPDGLQNLKTQVRQLGDSADDLSTSLTDLQESLPRDVKDSYKKSTDQARADIATTIAGQQRTVSAQAAVNAAELGDMFTRSIDGMAASSKTVRTNGAEAVDAQEKAGAKAEKDAAAAISAQVTSGLSSIDASVGASTKDLSAASTLLANDLNKVLLDLGTPKVKGSGLLGAMATNSALAGTADYQLALASETATSYASVRSQDLGGIMLRQAQVRAATEVQAALPAFQIEVPPGVAHRSVYSFSIGGAR